MKNAWTAFGAALALGFASGPATADHTDPNGEKLVPTFDILVKSTNPLDDYEPKIATTDLRLVTFTNVDFVQHDMYWTLRVHGLPNSVQFESIGFLFPGEHVTVAVEPGTHPYVCLEHPWMHGVLQAEE